MPETRTSSPDLAALSLTGRTAVVTGAASGIGRETALVLARAGAAPVICDIDAAGLEKTRQELIGLGVEDPLTVAVDLRNRSAVDALAQQAAARHGSLDIWANIAGVMRTGLVTDTTEEDLDLVLDSNLKGTYFGCAAAARIMTAQRSGAIINTASAGADMPAAGISAYAMSKAAVLMLTRSLATEVGRYGVRVNSIAPGFVDTPMVSHNFVRSDGAVNREAREAVFTDRAAQSPLGVTGEPWDIAMAVLYLASDAARFVTGQTLRPNGGVVMP
ncbi:SDR family NAD(P)-dependent oxidoreductase [Streptomyces sp. NPDC002577]